MIEDRIAALEARLPAIDVGIRDRLVELEAIQAEFMRRFVPVVPALLEWREARLAIFRAAPTEAEPLSPLFARLAEAENALMTVAGELAT